MYKQTKIYGFEVTLEIDDGVSSCFINKGKFSGSLEFLMAEGGLEFIGMKTEFLEVDQDTIDIIEDWALKHGY